MISGKDHANECLLKYCLMELSSFFKHLFLPSQGDFSVGVGAHDDSLTHEEVEQLRQLENDEDRRLRESQDRVCV